MFIFLLEIKEKMQDTKKDEIEDGDFEEPNSFISLLYFLWKIIRNDEFISGSEL